MVGRAANAAVYAAAAVSCWVAAPALSALACVNHAKYGTYADTKDSALGPCQAPPCTSASTSLISSATEVYSALSEFHAPAAARSEPGPGPLLNNAECTSGGAAMKMGAVIVSPRRRGTTPPRRHRVRHKLHPTRRRRRRSDQALRLLGRKPPHAGRHGDRTRPRSATTPDRRRAA